jgi:hypothetical protein
MANHKEGGDCEYCQSHGLYNEFPNLKKTGGNHAIQTNEQLQLFNDRRYRTYDPNAGAAINPGS